MNEKLRDIKIQKGEGIDPFLTEIQDIQDQLAVIREVPQDTKLVCLALNSLSEDWEIFAHVIFGQDTALRWDRMWSNLQKEGMRRTLVKVFINGNSSKGSKCVKVDDNVALASKGKAKGPNRGQGPQLKKKKKKTIYLRSSASSVMSFFPTILTIIKGRSKSGRIKIRG